MVVVVVVVLPPPPPRRVSPLPGILFMFLFGPFFSVSLAITINNHHEIIQLWLLSIRKALDLEIIPLELKLKAWVRALFFLDIQKVLWHYTTPAIRGTIWEKIHRKDDQGPPRFPYCDREWYTFLCNDANDNLRLIEY